ncbi:MAG: SDR family NAD(P)-dependent oxidoreductase [Actinomycetota bacterium]
MKLEDKVAVVTGGGRGIGRAICLAYAREGADLVVASNVSGENEAVADEIGSLGRKALAFTLDVCETGQVQAMAEAVLAAFGRVDILVSNAGIQRRALLPFSDEAEWKRVIEVNIYGAYHCCKAFMPGMIERNSGRVIIMSSVSGKMANPANSSYAVAKHGLIGLARSLAAEVARLGAREVTVNAICPGIVNTDIMTGPDGNIAMLSQMLGLSREEVWDQIYRPIILQERMLDPEEIAAMAVYLASQDARGITGQAVNVCGGMIMH